MSLEAHVFKAIKDKLLAVECTVLSFDATDFELTAEDELDTPILAYLSPEGGSWTDSENRRESKPRERASWTWRAGIEFKQRVDSDQILLALAKDTVIIDGAYRYTIKLLSDATENPPLNEQETGTKIDITFDVEVHRRI